MKTWVTFNKTAQNCSFFYNHFVTLFRILMSCFTTLDTKYNQWSKCIFFFKALTLFSIAWIQYTYNLDHLFIKQKITYSIWHNLTSKYDYFKRQFTYTFQMSIIHFLTMIYQLIQLLRMISNCCIPLNAWSN